MGEYLDGPHQGRVVNRYSAGTACRYPNHGTFSLSEEVAPRLTYDAFNLLEHPLLYATCENNYELLDLVAAVQVHLAYKPLQLPRGNKVSLDLDEHAVIYAYVYLGHA